MAFTLPEPGRFTTGFPGLSKSEGKGATRPRNVVAAEFKARLRRTAQLQAAAEIIAVLPSPGDSVHTLMTGYFDFAIVLTCVIRSHPSPCETLSVSTLAFSKRNVQEMAGWLDRGDVSRLTLLCCDYMRRMNSEIYQGAIDELVTRRGQTVAEAKTHAKVACLAFADGTRLTFEGSMNLRSARNIEQMTIINDAGVHDWHSAWIASKVGEYAARKG